MKADLIREIGRGTNKGMVGIHYNRSSNRGGGHSYADRSVAPTWREYRYDEVPAMNNLALFVEDKWSMPVGNDGRFEATAGLRSDITFIRESAYGTVSNLSPRINAKQTFWQQRNDRFVEALSLWAGWGKAVKLPSFEVLYPSPNYSDKLAFAPGTMADGTTYYAYYSIPSTALYNPDLKWQESRQLEVGIEMKSRWAKVMVSAFWSRTYHPYIATHIYTPYSYKLTDQRALESCEIPSPDRLYSIDQTTGIVTVSDKRGNYPAQQLAYNERNTYRSNTYYTNGSPVERRGVDWVIDFAQIPAWRTTFRIDGNYYYYKGIDESLIAWMPSSSITMADGNPYKYVGYYSGSSVASTSSGSSTSSSSITSTPTTANASVANGSVSKQLNTNLTITTHIPQIRMIFSLRIESTLYNYKRNLSESSSGTRGFVLEDPEGYEGIDGDIYGGDRYVGLYPLYYSTWENPDQRIPFAEKFAWAKENDPALYNELAKLVVKSNSNYYFNPNRISAYFSANISVTKEIGKIASLSFFATNFVNNMSTVKTSWNNLESTLYNSSYIPKFYYGLSLRLKL